MNIRKAERKLSKIKMALQGPSGCGKTYSSLLIAYGLIGDFSKICVLDTESGSADLYAHLGGYSVIQISKPYTPENYLEALELAEKEGFTCIIIDSLSHCWQYLIEYHASLSGNSFTNWSKITPRLNGLINAILSSPAHIISTLRVKQEYVLQDKGSGKLVPEKVGLKSIQREGVDYEFTLVFDLDIHHYATCSKDRTGIFTDHDPFIIGVNTGKQLDEWCSVGVPVETVRSLIQEATDIQQLTEVYKKYQGYFNLLEDDFHLQKAKIMSTLLNNSKNIQNGTITKPTVATNGRTTV